MNIKLIQKQESSDKREDTSTKYSSTEVDEKSSHYSKDFVNIVNLVTANQDLAIDFIDKQKDAVLPLNELEKYGYLALTTAALECKNKKEYRSFANRRLERMIKGAIAEAYFILDLQGKVFDKNEVGMGFASIEKTYC
jgi:hypothetical protein